MSSISSASAFKTVSYVHSPGSVISYQLCLLVSLVLPPPRMFSSNISPNKWEFKSFFKNSFMPSVLWHCWLGIRKNIWPVKIEWWGVDVVICLEWGAYGWHMVCYHKTPSSLTSFKSRLVLPFWYRLTQIVLEKRPLNVVVVVIAVAAAATHKITKFYWIICNFD